MLSYIFIGIFAIRHLHHLDNGVFLLPSYLNSPKDSLLSCCIAIITKINLWSIPQQLFTLFLGKGCTQRSHHIVDACSIHRYNIHIALNHQGKARFFYLTMCLVQAEKQLPFVKKYSFLGIEILGLPFLGSLYDSAPKTYNPASLIPNRNHYSIVKSVIQTAIRTTSGQITLLQQLWSNIPLYKGSR